MTAAERDLTIEQGATFIDSFVWHKEGDLAGTAGDIRDLTGWTARMQIRKRQGQPVLVDVSSEAPTTNGGRIYLGAIFGDLSAAADPTNGRVVIFLTDEDTDLLTSKSAVYDLELVKQNPPRVKRLMQGTITVDPNITQTNDDPAVGE